MSEYKKTLPSLRAVYVEPSIKPDDIVLAIELRKLLSKGYTKEKIIEVLSMVREDNL